MTTQSGNSFDDVRNLNLSAKDLLAKYGRVALEARKSDIQDPATRARVQELSDLIEKDVREYAGEIKKVETKHEKWPAAPKRGSHYQQALVVGGDYYGLIDNINSTISGPAIDLVAIMNDNNIAAAQAV